MLKIQNYFKFLTLIMLFLTQEKIMLIKRNEYLENIRRFYDSNLIKVITGIRRCGKSVLLSQIQDEIK